jgi:hypothetical protein
MSGDTFLAIIAVSLTAIFISVFAIECDLVWQRYRESRRRKMEEQTLAEPPAKLREAVGVARLGTTNEP